MLSTEQKITLLNSVSALSSLTHDQLEDLAAKSTVQVFSAGEKIFSQGDEDGGVYIVIKGQVTLDREISDDTDTVSIRTVNEGSYLGEISLFYDAVRSVTAQAVQDTVVLSLDHDAFCAFCRKNPDVLIELNHVICQRLVEAYDKISEIKMGKKPVELQHLLDKLDF